MSCAGCGTRVVSRLAHWLTPAWTGPEDPQGPVPFCDRCYDGKDSE